MHNTMEERGSSNVIGLLYGAEEPDRYLQAKTIKKHRRPKVNQPTKRAADYWPDLRTVPLRQSARTRKHTMHLHPNLRQSDTIGGGNIGIFM